MNTTILTETNVLAAKRKSLSLDKVISSNRLMMYVMLLFVVFDNQAFWRALYLSAKPIGLMDSLFIASVAFLLGALILAILTLINLPFLCKPSVIILLLVSSATAYFTDTYGVPIDRVMIQNLIETDISEAGALLSLKLMMYLFFLGVLPAIFVWRVKLVYLTTRKILRNKLKIWGACLTVICVMLVAFSSNYASFFRNHKEIRQMANPLNVIYAGSSYLSQDVAGSTIISPLGIDAHIGAIAREQTKPGLIILVVGETARADHFGLNGYERNTTPLLEKENIINFSQFSSCGTSTAVSLPCMFSAFERKDYDSKKARQQEGLLDVISHAGLPVLWRDNNSGCKGTCDRVTNEKLNKLNLPELCTDDECYDNILLHNLDSKVVLNKSQIIVLHQQGSHGPEYYRRYPEHMTHYTPVCKTNQLHDCSREQVVNAYDNTIRYTDQFLSKTINWLKTQEEGFNTAMIYVSDHGESLGENRLYLHGMPYGIAPDAQTHVPFMMWLSEGFKQDNRIDETCLRKLSSENYSHDNLFHSVLGMLDINTSVHQSDQDIFSSCRQ